MFCGPPQLTLWLGPVYVFNRDGKLVNIRAIPLTVYVLLNPAICETHDWLKDTRNFDLRKFPPEVFGKLVCWSPCHVKRRGVAMFLASRKFVFVESKFGLKCGNCSVQVDGVLLIYCVETEQYSAYFV